MPRIAAATRGELDAVLARFGVQPRSLHTIRAGRMNRHWRVVTTTGVYALRRYRRSHPADIAYEMQVLNLLAGCGWPVAPALPRAAGEATVTHAGSAYALFPFLPGRPRPYDSDRYRRIKGVILARLHRDLAQLPAPAQRPGHSRLAEPDTALHQAGYAGFDQLAGAYARADPTGGDILRREWQETTHELATARAEQPPPADQLIHADFHTANLLFVRGRLTGLLDLDSTRRDWRVADVATALSLDCRAAPEYNAIAVPALRAFLDGYETVWPLTAGERRLLPALLRMHTLGMAGMRLRDWALTGNPRALRSIERTVYGRIPAWKEQRADVSRLLTRLPETGTTNKEGHR